MNCSLKVMDHFGKNIVRNTKICTAKYVLVGIVMYPCLSVIQKALSSEDCTLRTKYYNERCIGGYTSKAFRPLLCM